MEKEIVAGDLPRIEQLLEEILGVKGYKTVERMGGLTNRTYHVFLEDEREYAVRIPGEGTEELIVRANEKISTELANTLGIDARCLYFGEDGAKLTEYIPNALTMSAEAMKEPEHIKQVADIFKKLHSCGKDTGVPFEVFDMAAEYEKIIAHYKIPMYADYFEVKQTVMEIKKEIDMTCDTARVPCHNDPLCENWILGDGKMYLIDWEYAGMNDAMWDLADVSIEAEYDRIRDEEILTAYFGIAPNDKVWKHFLANKIYVDYLWTLWAKTRVPFDGQPMEAWADQRYIRLKKNIEELKQV